MSEEFELDASPIKVRRFSSPKALRVISFVAPAIVGGAVVASVMNFGVFGGGSRLPQAILISPSGQSAPSSTTMATTSTLAASTSTSTSTSAATVVTSSTVTLPPVKTSALEIVPTTSKVFAYENASSTPSEISSSEAGQSQSSVDSIVDNGESSRQTTSTTATVSTQASNPGKDGGHDGGSTTTTTAVIVPTTEGDNAPSPAVSTTAVNGDN
ncbi:MAG: hypothetical protein M0T78_00700 [Actinomycetota bacterium]|nr:hypothetical protein [Actinomycetota bacterium]